MEQVASKLAQAELRSIQSMYLWMLRLCYRCNMQFRTLLRQDWGPFRVCTYECFYCVIDETSNYVEWLLYRLEKLPSPDTSPPHQLGGHKYLFCPSWELRLMNNAFDYKYYFTTIDSKNSSNKNVINMFWDKKCPPLKSEKVLSRGKNYWLANLF